MNTLNRQNPLLWVGLLLLAWLVLGVQLAAPKAASGPFYAATEHHLGVTRWESAPRLGLDAWTTKSVSGSSVVQKGNGTVTDNAAHNAASYAQLKLDLKTTEAANNIVDSLRTTGTLPSNYVTKAQAAQQGWQPGKVLNNSVPGGQMGGDVFHNTTNVLPSSPGRTWFEADIGLNGAMSRSNQAGTRLLYSNDGLLYITTDHYKTVAPIGTWK